MKSSPLLHAAMMLAGLWQIAAGASLRAEAPVIELSQAVVFAPAAKSSPERKAVQMLIEEVEKRSRIRWDEVTKWPTAEAPVIVIGTAEALRGAIDRAKAPIAINPASGGPDGYQIKASGGNPAVVWVIGNDPRGVLFGVGGLLRNLRMDRDRITLPSDLQIQTAPKKPLRGHQLGYRPKTNSYDGWTVAMWEQYIRDLAVFGCNAIELIPPRSDDAADSPHFPLPPMRMMVEMSRLADAYGLDVWVWYPAMDLDYCNPKTVEFALKEWGEVFRALPRLDAVFVPGGDPGHTSPKNLFSLLERQVENVHRFHPKCQMWVSPQGFSKARLDEFLALLEQKQPWLTGVVYGPQVRMSLPEFRKALPPRWPIRDYPDITHSRHCQYPVPDWDVAFALTEGREGSNPRPEGMANIYRLSSPHTIGFITYSEGCHDDVNKCIWSALGWDDRTDVRSILREYGRYFIGPKHDEAFAEGLLALEKNWRGAAAQNEGIDTTLQNFRMMEKTSSPAVRLNWRFQQALYRAYYDAFIRARLRYETELEAAALARLRDAEKLSSLKAMTEAEAILDRAIREPVAADLRARVFELAEALFQSIRAQLSVPRYQAIAVERGANLDSIDHPLNNSGWLKKRFAAIRPSGNESQRLAQIKAILNRTDPGPGGFYDDLGDPNRQPHLVKGEGPDKDPAFYATPLVGFGFRGAGADRSLPIEWWQHAESLYDAPLKMHYAGLDAKGNYRVRVVYGRERLANKIRLIANDKFEIHGNLARGLEPLEFDIPAAATAGGELTLVWRADPGAGGTGRGCQVVEVFLLKKQ
jgi:hypothetical protein